MQLSKYIDSIEATDILSVYAELRTLNPAKELITAVAVATERSEARVRMWFSTGHFPKFAQSRIAKLVGKPAETLFSNI